ncbi:hypothetical protein T06_3623 [Trichinella sp. T6]|nr:hypothetical protein T06_3623 [Trichinella sp. T6]
MLLKVKYLKELLVQMLLESETFPGRFWKVPRKTNGYVLNKCPLNSTCAYLNTQGNSPCGTPLILIDDRKISDIIMSYKLKMPRLVQYFVVLGKSIFLHFRSISNKLKKVVSIWVEMCIKSSIC